MSHPISVTFNVFVNDEDWTIALAEGQSISFCSGGPTDEGYSYTEKLYKYEDGYVTVMSSNDGCDCDGRLSSYREYTCHHTMLAAHHNAENGLDYPVWEIAESSQRDYAAEAMGY